MTTHEPIQTQKEKWNDAFLSNELYVEKEDFRFGILVDELAKSNIPTTEAEHLHRWLAAMLRPCN
jgi:hypothetical protein